MEIVLVAAMDLDGFIGQDGGLPWHLPADLAHFKRLTRGKPVIMGRKTAMSLTRALPDRVNIVLTRDPSFAREGFAVARSKDEALRLAGIAPEAMIVGGSEIYALYLDDAKRLELTEVQARTGGDTRFPPFDRAHFAEIARRETPADDRNVYAMVFRTLVRK